MSVYCLDDMAYEELGKENEERRRETPEAPMNSDHAPTAEEQLPPLDELAGAELHLGYSRDEAALRCRERQLLAALRENREKDARIAGLEVLERTVKFMSDSYLEEHGNWGICKWRVQSEAAEAKLRAVSDALDEKPVTVFHVGELEYYLRSEIDVPLSRIRAIVEGK